MADMTYRLKERLKHFFWTIDIQLLCLIPVLLGLLLIVLPPVISKDVLSEPISKSNLMIFLTIGSFLGCAGVIEIIRKESPSIFGKSKITSIIHGILAIFLFWGLAFVGFL